VAGYAFGSTSLHTRHRGALTVSTRGWPRSAARTPPTSSQPFLAGTAGGTYVWRVPTAELAAGATSSQVVVAGSDGSPSAVLAPITVPLQ